MTEQPETEEYETVELTWEGTYLIHLAALDNPEAGYEATKSSREELARMARLADKAVAFHKATGGLEAVKELQRSHTELVAACRLLQSSVGRAVRENAVDKISELIKED